MITTQRLIYLLCICSAFLLVYCNQGIQRSEDITYLNLQDSVQYMGMATCRSCHNEIHESFIKTGMGLSFDWASKEKSSAQYDQHALVYDQQSNFYYYPFFKDSLLHIREFRLNGKDTIHNRVEKVSYIVGSGQHTNSHIIDENGYIYQAPITYYTQEGRWDMAPSFKENNQRFSRLLTTECITCHNHYPEHVPGSMNKYTHMPRGIECERCHGPGEIHVKEKLAGNIIDTSKYADPTIVNPKRLSRDLLMDLCQRCHLQGVAVLKEGKSFFDFKPGMELESVVNVFLPRYTDSHKNFIMASQADRLRKSPCYILSEEMTCLTCHHPHHSVEETPRSQYNEGCISCHSSQKDLQMCSVSEAQRLAENNDCASCHMQRSGSIDIPHVNITDHYIHKSTAKQPNTVDTISEEDQEEIAEFLGLEILTKDKGTPLEMAQGYIALFDKYVSTKQMLDSAAVYIRQIDLPFKERYKTDIHFLFASQRYQALLNVARKIANSTDLDGWTAYRIGEAYFQVGNNFEALRFFKKAVEKHPYDLDFLEKLGSTHLALENMVPARKTFEFILEENPKRPRALTNLGYIYATQGKIDQAKDFYHKALQLDPDFEQALINLAAIHLVDRKKKEVKKLIDRVLKINPDNRQVQDLLRRLDSI